MEAAGVVVEAGAKSKYKKGDRVIANALWGARSPRSSRCRTRICSRCRPA
jgi:threonine dehydrogenase-like Zn-dependent dehydrogenase